MFGALEAQQFFMRACLMSAAITTSVAKAHELLIRPSEQISYL
jgi:hypothetical protein